MKTLLVEDNPADARLIREMLRKPQLEGLQLEHVGRLESAMDRSRSQHFDVVLLDLGLPDSQGMETLWQMQKVGGDSPIVVLTGLNDLAFAAGTVRAGAQDYLIKGQFDERMLLRTIRYAVERKLAEQALRDAHQLSRSIIDSLPGAFAAFDRRGRLLQWNSYVESTFGYDRHGSRPMSALQFVAKSDRSLVAARMKEAFEAGAAEVEARLVSRTGVESLQYIRARRLMLGQQSCLVAVAFDITDRKRTEEELRNRERLYHSVVNSMAEGMVLLDAEGKIMAHNPAALQIHGRTAEQMVGRTADDPQWGAVHEDGSPFPGSEHPVAITLRTGRPQSNVVMGIRRPDAQQRWISINSQPLIAAPGERPYAVVATYHDFTDRKRLEEELHEKAELLNLAHDAVLVRDLQNRILFWNRGAERITGWTAAEACGKDLVELMHVDPAKYKMSIEALLKSGNWNGEILARTRAGEEIRMESRWTLVRDRSGNPKSILSISTDITEKTELEAQLLRAQRMESLGTLAGGIAHDLNNILTPLLMSVRMLREDMAPHEKTNVLDILEANVLRGTNLVKQVLAFGRGVKGERIPVRLQLIVREIEQIIQETFPKSIEFSFRAAPELWTVLGDATQIHQVLLNLCVNSRDAMPDGGKLSVALENTTLSDQFVRLNPGAKAGSFVAITVHDTGAGIPKDIQEKIFDPFFTTKEPGKGTGLGLSTSLAIVRSHGGFIHCRSEVTVGSTFSVYLPATREATARPREDHPDTELPRGHNELILVVDDEEGIRIIVKRTLELFNYRVLLAMDGAEAVALYRSHRAEIAAVLTDVAMPVMDGAAVVKELKSIDPDVRIIVSSGFQADEQVEQATQAGAQCFISKPYTSTELLRALRGVLHLAG